MSQTCMAMATSLPLLLAAPLRAAEQQNLEELTKNTPPGAGEQESLLQLAEKTQNPVPDQIKVQFQDYLNFGVGPDHVEQNVLNGLGAA